MLCVHIARGQLCTTVIPATWPVASRAKHFWYSAPFPASAPSRLLQLIESRGRPSKYWAISLGPAWLVIEKRRDAPRWSLRARHAMENRASACAAIGRRSAVTTSSFNARVGRDPAEGTLPLARPRTSNRDPFGAINTRSRLPLNRSNHTAPLRCNYRDEFQGGLLLRQDQAPANSPADHRPPSVVPDNLYLH